MGDITREKVRGYRARRKRAQRYTAAFLAFATLVGCGVGWSLRQTGISATAEAFCGAEEHTHTQECYEKVLICGLEEGETLPTEAPHEHTDSCYEEKLVAACAQEEHTHTEGCYAMQRNLTCTAQEHSHTDACYTLTGGSLVCAAQEHTHSDGCKDAEGNIVCGLSEHTHGDGCYSPVEKVLSCTLQEHTHGDSCYGPAQKTLICGHAEHTHTAECMKNEKVLVCTLPTQQEPQEPHVHTDACYEEKLICGKTEHTHSELCFSNTAARETEEQWAAAAGNPGSGIWAIDLLGVASSQLGYEEVKENFILDENGGKKFYTRYGDSYGDPYGSWNGMFLAYCLKYAGVPESVVPRRAGVAALLADMASAEHLKNPGEYDPQPGDIAVFGDRVGVIGEPGDPLTVICGNVDGKVAEIHVAAASVSKYIQVAVVGAGQNDFTTLEDESGANSINYVDIPSFDSVFVTINGIEYNVEDVHDIEIPEGAILNFNMDYGLTQPVDGVRYKLPNNIKVESVENKPVMDTRRGHEDEIIGSYDIKDGYVYIRYFDSLWETLTQTYPGHLEFSGKASKNSDGAYDKIDFPGGASLTFTPAASDTDLTVSKSIDRQNNKTYKMDENGNIEIQYKVTLSSEKGSGTRDLSFSDVLNDPQSGTKIPGKYKGTPTVTKIFYTNGWQENKQTIDGKVTVSADGNSFEVNGLDALGATEKYEVTYTVLVEAKDIPTDYEGTIGNYVLHEGGKTHQDVSISHKDWISKRGSYNPDEGNIEWTIHVDSPSGSLDGFTLKDLLPDSLTEADIVGSITLIKDSKPVTDSNGNEVTLTPADLITNGYTFQGDIASNPPYDIKFKTNFQGSGENVDVTNKAKLEKDDKTYDAIGTVKISKDNWSTYKKFLRAEDSAENGYIKNLYWEIGATNGAGSKKFEYTDTFVNPAEAGETIVHYGTVEAITAAMEANLTVTLTNGKKLTYGDLEANGIKVSLEWTKQGEKVTAFKLTFESTGEYFIKSFQFLNCPSIADVTGVPESSEWTFKNQFNWNEATYTYRNTKEFEKMASFTSDNGYSDYVKSNEKKTVYYQVEARSSEDTFTIQDQVEMYLPENQDIGKICNIYWYGEKYDDNDWNYQHPHVNAQSAYDAENHLFKLTFDVSNFSSDGQEHSLIIRYEVNYSFDTRWNDPNTSTLKFINTAKMGEKSESATAEIYYDLKKTGTQDYVGTTTDKESKARTITYTVVINPNGTQFLSDSGGMLTLTDTFSSNNNMGKIVDRSSVQLYRGTSAADCTEANRLSESEYTKTVDMNSSPWLTLAVPDATPLVLQYTCELDWSKIDGGETFNFGNSVSLQGVVSTNNTVSVYKPTSSSDIGSSQLRVLKVDSKTHAALPNATLKLEKYDSQSKSWSVLNAGFTTDSEGIHAFGIASDASSEGEGTVVVNTLYRVVETIAPKGYYLDDTPRYVIICGKSTTEDKAFELATGQTDSVTDADGRIIQRSAVIFGTSNLSTEVEVPNNFDYRLPKTGGTGTKNFVLFGAFAMILAGCGMVVTRKKHYTGVYER